MNTAVRATLCVLLLAMLSCGTLEVTLDHTPTPNVLGTGTLAALQTQNSELATRIVSANISVSTPAPAETLPVTVAAPVALRITFINGSSVGVVSAPIAAGQTQQYVLDALKGQPMYVYVSSADKDVTVSIRAEDGTTLLSSEEKHASWQGTLPDNGDYYLTVHGGASTENFTMAITLPWRLQFSPGANSATVNGRTVAGYNVSYSLFASKGQTMSVDIEQHSSKVSLSIYGFTDGQQYLRAEKGESSFEFVLPETQDYIIVVIPMSGLEVSYIMTVHVK